MFMDKFTVFFGDINQLKAQFIMAAQEGEPLGAGRYFRVTSRLRVCATGPWLAMATDLKIWGISGK